MDEGFDEDEVVDASVRSKILVLILAAASDSQSHVLSNPEQPNRKQN